MKSSDTDNKELNLARLTSCLFVLLLGATHLSAAVTQKRTDVLMKQYLDADQHVYTALERVPVRHWGDRSLAAQFWRLRDEINRKIKAEKRPSHEEVKSFAEQFEQSCSRVLSQLKINTAKTYDKAAKKYHGKFAVLNFESPPAKA